MKRNRILIFGDVILDEEVRVERGLPSAEDGLPSHREISRCYTAGGAANVAKHLARLGAHVTLVHQGQPIPISSDELTGQEALRISQVGHPGGGIPTKTRFYCGNEKLFKLNRPGVVTHEPPDTAGLLRQVLARGGFQLVLACDNADSFFRGDNREALVAACKQHRIPLWVDAQLSQTEPDFSRWEGADALFLNSAEWASVRHISTSFPSFHHKRGRAGSDYIPVDGRIQSHPGFEVEVVDTVGAGDAYLAAFAVSDDIAIANAWAALACTTHGTRLPWRAEIERFHEIAIRFSQSA